MCNYYNKIARGYNELYEGEQKKKLDLIAMHAKIKGDMKLLDVGCGTGIVQRYFDCISVGIDPSEELLKQNPKKCIKGAAEKMPFDDDSFDVVISLTSMQNFDDVEKGIKEIKRVGKKLFILSFLRNSKKGKMIEKAINKNFKIIKRLQQEKDTIFILR